MTDWGNRWVLDEGPEDAKILFVGEAPGEHEHEQGRPFIGPSGDMLMACLARYGVIRESVRLANLFHYRPQGNKFARVANTKELQDSVKQLHEWIAAHRPTVIVPLGSWPLYYLTNKARINQGVATGIMKWRGSIITYAHDTSIKVIPTIHPAAVIRDRTLYPIFDHDIRRIVEDSAFPELRLPVREFILDPRGLDCEEWTQRLCVAEFLGCDIETIKKSRHILCMGFAPTPKLAVVFSTTHAEGRRAIERVLASPAKKIFQFGTFDVTQLKLNGYSVNDPVAASLGRPYFWDTLIAQHVIQPELPRSLEYLTSVYTREPYYKTEGRGTIPDDAKGWSSQIDRAALYTYNGRDCCCTIEIAIHQMDEIAAHPSRHIFDYEMSVLEVAHHISDSGMPIDEERRALIEIILLDKWRRKQSLLNALTGYDTNVRSMKLPRILYDKDKLGLPTRRKRDGTITADEDAIVSLISYCKDHIESLKTDAAKMQWEIKLNVCKLILEIRGIRQVLSNYILKELRDKTRRIVNGRIHSTYKVGATETARWAAMKYVDGTGYNAQTLPRDPIEASDETVKMAQEVVDALVREALSDLEDDENSTTEPY